ncbi:MAG: hypothetical protein KDG55_08795 [Rhodocyclaceae bacterium]|nr:hypothetical protein [Rhodocyclaceae bacterium]
MFFTRSIVVAVPEYEPPEGKVEITPRNEINVKAINPERSVFMVTMKTSFNDEMDTRAPYMADMECVGFFNVDRAEVPSVEEAVRGVTVTSHAVLYGAIREAIGWISGRQPYGPLTLGLSILAPNTEVSRDDDGKPEGGPSKRKTQRARKESEKS